AINPLYLHGTLADTVRINLTEGHAQKWAFMYGSGRLSQILGLSLAGMVLGRTGFFSRPEGFARMRMAGLLLALAAAAALYWLREPLAGLVPAGEGMTMPRDRAWTILGSLFDVAVMAVLLFGFLVLYHGPAQRVLGALAPGGRMTLALYVARSRVCVPLFYGYGLGLYASMAQLQAVAWGLAGFALQLAFG